ncbi:unnamed protein product [Effrenium voratum]|nr:unnamed protein product [Effrenium voratum]
MDVSVGDAVEAYWPDEEKWLPAEISAVHQDGYAITWDGSMSDVPADYVRKPASQDVARGLDCQARQDKENGADAGADARAEKELQPEEPQEPTGPKAESDGPNLDADGSNGPNLPFGVPLAGAVSKTAAPRPADPPAPPKAAQTVPPRFPKVSTAQPGAEAPRTPPKRQALRPPAPPQPPKAPQAQPQVPIGAAQAPIGAPGAPIGAPQAPKNAPQAPTGAPQAPIGKSQVPHIPPPQPQPNPVPPRPPPPHWHSCYPWMHPPGNPSYWQFGLHGESDWEAAFPHSWKGSWSRKGEGKEGKEGREPSQQEVALQKARQEEQREARLAEVLEQDLTKGLAELREAKKQGTVSPALVAKALELAVAQGHVALVKAMESLFLETSLELDIPSFAGLMERLALDPFAYRPTAVRLLLNLALSQDSPVVPLAPEALTEAEQRASLLADVEQPKGGVAVGSPGASPEDADAKEDAEDAADDAEATAEEEDAGGEWPEELVLRGCVRWPELNGTFARTREFEDHFGRPIYKREMGEKPLFCFYWQFSSLAQSGKPVKKKRKKGKESKSKEAGWWLGPRVGEKVQLRGFCPSDAELPPKCAWRLAEVREVEDADADGLEAREAQPAPEAGFVSQEELCVEALLDLDVGRLRGRVVADDPSSAKYFGHFCALLHLEYFVELAAVRCRASRRSGEELARGGWALVNLKVREVSSKGKGKGKGDKGKGKGKADGFLLTLALPPETDIDRLRLKRGDSVVLSATHPLKDKVGEGQLQDITPSEISISVEGLLFEGLRERTWRIDKGNNRLSYGRQLGSLVSLCTGSRPKVFEMITSAKVGHVDAWAARWAEKAQGATESLADASFEAGDRVRLFGLNTEELNGQEGEVTDGSLPALGERVNVKVGDVVKAVRPSNLQKLPAVSVTGAVQALAAESAPADAENLARCREQIAALPCTDSQKQAVDATLERRCTIIQGPPGTGKTTTAVQVLRSWAQMGLKPLLAVADNNIAVDNIAVGLAKLNVNLKTVRVGRPEKIRPELEQVILESQCRQAKQAVQDKKDAEERSSALSLLHRLSVSDLKAKAASLHASLDLKRAAAKSDEVEADAEPGEAPASEVLDAVLDAVVRAQAARAAEEADAKRSERSRAEEEADEKKRRSQARREDAEIQLQVLKDADIICAQLITAGGTLLSKLGPFKGILIDEIAQATELVSIVPIVARKCDRLVLAGDHCQLPPTVQSPEAERRGLTLSLYGRLVKEGVEPFFLDTQFRAHPKLMEWVAGSIYENRLRSGIPDSARPAVEGFEWPRKKVPVAFVEMGRWACESEEHESKMNQAEAEKVIHIIESVLAAGCSAEDVGVVTPYMAQVRLLRSLWKARCQDLAKGSKKAKSHFKNPRILEIASVDNFQGREKELIVFSAVRNNSSGRVGFLADWRRLNVMLTRARRGLVIVGNAFTLSKDSYWSNWLEWCRRHRVVVDKEAWHAVVRAAKKAAPKRVKPLVHHLFDFEQAPQTEKAFRRFAAEKLAGKLEGEADVDLLWEAVSTALAEAALASEQHSKAEGQLKALTAVATAELDQIPVLEDKALAAPDPSRRTRWRSWKFVAQEILWCQDPGQVWPWKALRAKMLAYYQEYLTAKGEADDRPNKQLFREMRESLPSEWFRQSASEQLEVFLAPSEHQQAARHLWKANRDDGLRPFQRRVVPWALVKAAVKGDVDEELGVQMTQSQEAVPKPKTKKRTDRHLRKGLILVLAGGRGTGQRGILDMWSDWQLAVAWDLGP